MKFQIKKKLKYNKFQRRNIRATKIQIMKGNDHYQRKKKKIKFKKTILNLMLTIIRLKELFYGVINQLKIYHKKNKFGTRLLLIRMKKIDL